jgi:hypothetical protein
MNIGQLLFNLTTFTVSAAAAVSVLVHDTNVDKAALVAVADRADVPIAEVKIGNKPHTHSDRNSLHQAIRDINASQPRTQPRNQQDKKYQQSKPTARGHHPFDNYTLPVFYLLYYKKTTGFTGRF